MTALDVSRRSLHGDPGRFSAAAVVLRRGRLRPASGPGLPGDYPAFAVARLLDALAAALRGDVPPGHEVVAAATEIAEHVLAYAGAPGPAHGTDPGVPLARHPDGPRP